MWLGAETRILGSKCSSNYMIWIVILFGFGNWIRSETRLSRLWWFINLGHERESSCGTAYTTHRTHAHTHTIKSPIQKQFWHKTMLLRVSVSRALGPKLIQKWLFSLRTKKETEKYGWFWIVCSRYETVNNKRILRTKWFVRVYTIRNNRKKSSVCCPCLNTKVCAKPLVCYCLCWQRKRMVIKKKKKNVSRRHFHRAEYTIIINCLWAAIIVVIVLVIDIATCFPRISKHKRSQKLIVTPRAPAAPPKIGSRVSSESEIACHHTINTELNSWRLTFCSSGYCFSVRIGNATRFVTIIMNGKN